MLTSRPRRSLLLFTALAAASLAALVAARPQIHGPFWSHGDDLALVVTWFVAVAASIWLLATTGACLLALGLGRPHLARLLAPALPVGIRRFVEVAVVATCVALPVLPARAAPLPTTSNTVVADQPVVRAPDVRAPTPTVAPVSLPASTHVAVRPGDNLWLIARGALTRTSTRRPTDTEVARYWRLVITANRSTLRSGDPSLIFPGEIVTLPPVSVLP